MNLLSRRISKLINLKNDNKTIVNNMAGAVAIKGAALLLSLLMMPAYIKFFDNYKLLGVWFAILSMLTWILFFDLGIGNGLRNRLVDTFVNHDIKEAKHFISSAYCIVGLIVIVLATCSYFIIPLLNWNSIFNISIDIISNDTLIKVVKILIIGILLQFLLKLVTSILFALQKSAFTNLIPLFSNAFMLLFISLYKSSDLQNSIVVIAWVNILAVNIPLLIATLFIFIGRLKECKPSFRYVNNKYIQGVMSLGGVFFLLQVMFLAVYNTNQYLITWFIGPEQVVEYEIYNKLFNLPGVFLLVLLTPIWSAVTKAKSEKNYTWIKKLNKLLSLVSVAVILGEFILIIFAQDIFNLWLGINVVKINYQYAFVYTFSGSLFIYFHVITAMTNGMGLLKVQLICLTLAAILKIPLVYVGLRFYDNWITIVIVNIIIILPYCIIQPLWFNKKLEINIREMNQV